MTTDILENTKISREEAMDLAVEPVIKGMSANELAHIYRDMMVGRNTTIAFILSDMSHANLAVVYVENCGDEALEEWTGRTIDPDLDDY